MIVWMMACTAKVPPPPPTPARLPPVAAWLRMERVALGCAFAEAGGAVDAAWGCGAPPSPAGDPCADTEHYYAGPPFPAELRAALPVLVTGVDLAWEGGTLQAVTVSLPPGADPVAARAALGLAEPLPENVRWAEVQGCAADHQCLVIEGFEHLGAGDVDCE